MAVKQRPGDKQPDTAIRTTCGNCEGGWRPCIERVTTYLVDGKKWTDVLPYQYPEPDDYETDDRVVRHYRAVEKCFCQGEK